MARIRTIKPDFFTSLTIADLSLTARLTFIGLWTHVDDAGRCVDDPRLIKAAVWPLDDLTASDVELDLKALSESSLITRYTLNRKRYIAVTGWDEHQRINRPTPSKLPAPEQGDPLPPEPPTRGDTDSPTPHGGRTEGSNEDRGTARDGSQMGPADASHDATADYAAMSASEASQRLAGGRLTSINTGFTDNSMSTHARLNEDSPQERKGKERNREGKGREGAAEAVEQAELAVAGDSDSVGAAEAAHQEPEPVTAQTIVAEWIDRCAKRPPGQTIGQTSKQIKKLIEDGIDPDDIRRGLAKWMAKGSAPSAIPSFVNEAMNAASAWRPSNVIQLPSSQPRSTTDERVQAALDLGRQMQAEYDATQAAKEAQ